MDKQTAKGILREETATTLKAAFNEYVKPFKGEATPARKEDLIASLVEMAEEFGYADLWDALRYVTAYGSSARESSRDYRKAFSQD